MRTNAERLHCLLLVTQNVWTVRLFELQAVLDLYLCAMRRLEDEEQRPLRSWSAPKPAFKAPQECREGKCGHYPPLRLEGFEKPKDDVAVGEYQQAYHEEEGQSPAEGKNDDRHERAEGDKHHVSNVDEDGEIDTADSRVHPSECIITRRDVEEHLSRRGAHADHYEHPLKYAASDLRALRRNSFGEVVVDYTQRELDDFYTDSDYSSVLGDGQSDNEPLELCSNASTSDIHASSHEGSSNSSPPSSSTFSRAPAQPIQVLDPAHRSGILNLALAVLRQAKQVKNVSLTRSLHHILDRKPLPLESVRFLSIGPVWPPSETQWCLHGVKLPALEKLRICGYFIESGTAKQISGLDADRSWPRLKNVEWDFGPFAAETGYAEER